MFWMIHPSKDEKQEQRSESRTERILLWHHSMTHIHSALFTGGAEVPIAFLYYTLDTFADVPCNNRRQIIIQFYIQSKLKAVLMFQMSQILIGTCHKRWRARFWKQWSCTIAVFRLYQETNIYIAGKRSHCICLTVILILFFPNSLSGMD